MDLSEIVQQSTILENICSNLTFEEAIEFRKALNVESLNCHILIEDRDQMISILDKVNDDTIKAYNIIKQYGSKSALQQLTFFGVNSIIKILMDHGFNIDKNIRWENIALIWASKNSDLKTIKILLEYGTNINFTDSHGITALITSVEKNNLEIVKFLLEHGADANIINQDGDTALIWASGSDNLKIVEILLEHGADINIVNNDGYTALTIALRNGNREIVKLLLEHEAVKIYP